MEKKLYSPIEVLGCLNRKITREMKLAFVSAIVSGLIAHGFFLTNKIPLFDDAASPFGVGGTFNHGRWFLAILSRCVHLFWGNTYSLSWLLGIISIVLIAFSSCLIINMFSIHNSILITSISVLMVVFPVVTATFGYMYTSAYYFVALFMTVMAVWLTARYKWGCFAGGTLLMLGLGIYQAFFPIAIVLFLLLIMFELVDNVELKEVWKHIGKYIATLGVGMVMYFIMNKLFIMIINASLTSYQGIDTMGHVTVKDLYRGIVNAYSSFIHLMIADNMGLSVSVVLRVSLFLMVILSIIILGKLVFLQIKEIIAKCLFSVAILLYPIAVNFIYIMCCSEGAFVYSLMLYSSIFFFIFPLILFDKYEQKYASERLGTILQWVVIFLNVIVIFYYIGFDNITYSKASLIQQQVDTYCNTLVTQIKSVDGYTDDYPIILVQDREKDGIFDFSDASMVEVEEYNNIFLNPYGGTMKNWIRDYSFEYYFKYRMGFATKLDKDVSQINNMNEIKQMPCYPQSGSIKVIDNQIVVKLSEY